MTKKTGGRILVESLAVNGVNTIFGVPGESYLDALNALYEHQDIRYITCRHEGGAAFMAEAHAKLTSRPGVCFVTRGPGASNASIGVHAAFQNSTPLILLVGQVPRRNIEREAFQEMARFKAALHMRGPKIMRDNVAPFSTPRPHESIRLRCPHKTGYQRTQDDGRSSFGGRRTGQRPGRPAWREPPARLPADAQGRRRAG
ncbi:Acetolactate synthase large subunit [Caballeronia sordidicola]|uniref:Acetolactate synthase large subunit n=1 Tax=Caballeronia sordidicola TaxID=196367 RepID=A0A226WUX3_CABSO|nr:Acetolactate synthase large subunit [Caballeronia sordidicola]